ncbi:MAG: hypothetical protein P1U77_18175, partial [Rubripirellula sp.]|nr:hypothetical protein [Rubripirellula sp.]
MIFGVWCIVITSHRIDRKRKRPEEEFLQPRTVATEQTIRRIGMHRIAPPVRRFCFVATAAYVIKMTAGR